MNLNAIHIIVVSRSRWPHGLSFRSAASRLLRLWVRILPKAWMSVCCKCCVLSGRGLCDGPITRPEESYRLWCVVVCDLEISWMRRPWPSLLLLLLLLFVLSSLVTGLSFPVLLLNQRWSPPLTLQASHCSTFRIMCDVPSIAVFCSESIECYPGTASKFFLKLLVTIPVAPIH